jgi:hypothetical protein
MMRDSYVEKNLNNQQNSIIDVDCVEGQNHILEILVSVEFVWEDMRESD